MPFPSLKLSPAVYERFTVLRRSAGFANRQKFVEHLLDIEDRRQRDVVLNRFPPRTSTPARRQDVSGQVADVDLTLGSDISIIAASSSALSVADTSLPPARRALFSQASEASRSGSAPAEDVGTSIDIDLEDASSGSPSSDSEADDGENDITYLAEKTYAVLPNVDPR